MKIYTSYFSSAYGTGNYGCGLYSTEQHACAAAGSTAGTSGSTANSGLTNTGIAIAAIVTLACFIIFVGLAVRIWRRKPVLEVQTVDADASDDEQVNQVPRS